MGRYQMLTGRLQAIEATDPRRVPAGGTFSGTPCGALVGILLAVTELVCVQCAWSGDSGAQYVVKSIPGKEFLAMHGGERHRPTRIGRRPLCHWKYSGRLTWVSATNMTPLPASSNWRTASIKAGARSGGSTVMSMVRVS